MTEATGAGAAAVTVNDTVPERPSLEAVIVEEPTATPVATPLVETVALAGVPLDQVTARPVNTLPLASRVVAVSCVVAPTVTLGDAGVIETVATAAGGAAVTVTEADPLCPSLVAVMDVEPAATAVTNPEPETDAMPALPLDHATARPDNAFPLASRVVAESCAVAPTCRFGDPGETETVATAAGG